MEFQMSCFSSLLLVSQYNIFSDYNEYDNVALVYLWGTLLCGEESHLFCIINQIPG